VQQQATYKCTRICNFGLTIGTRESQRMNSRDSRSHPRQSTPDPVVRAKVFGTRENTILCVPLFLVEKRETEMFQRAYELGIKPEEWNGSLLSWKLQTLYPNRAKHPQSVFAFELYPESEFAVSICSQDFQWEPWMNQTIESFYKTGRIRVPDFCVGSDLLTALEYFGIFYDVDLLVFDSFSTFLRVKNWSEYFWNREVIATWILEKLREAKTSTRVFSTCPRVMSKGSYLAVSTRQAEVFDGGISWDPKQHCETQSSVLVYRFFNISENETYANKTTDDLAREDFCKYLRKVVPGTNASFPKKLVTIHHADGTSEELELATLYIQLEDPELLRADDPSTSHDVDTALLSGLSDSHGPSDYTLPVCRFLDTLAFSQYYFSDAKPLVDSPCNVSYEIKALCEDLEVPTPNQCLPAMTDYHPTDPPPNQRSIAKLLVDPPSNIAYKCKAKCEDFELLWRRQFHPGRTHSCTTDSPPAHSNTKRMADPSCIVVSLETTGRCEDVKLPKPRQCHSAKARRAPDPPASGQLNFLRSPRDVTQSHQVVDPFNAEKRPQKYRIQDCHDCSLGPTVQACNLPAYVQNISSEESTMDQSAELLFCHEASCETNDRFREARIPTGDFWTAKGKPVVNPECVSASPYTRIEESDIPNVWMPWDLADKSKEGAPSLLMVSRGKGRLQHLRPLPSEASGSRSVAAHQSGAMAFNHIYEDLMLQDTDFFFDGWGEPKTRATNLSPTDVSSGATVMLDEYDEGDKLKRVHSHVHDTLLRYEPTDFVCDVASLFVDAADGYSDCTNDFIKENNQFAALKRRCDLHDLQHRPHRLKQKRNQEHGDRRIRFLESPDRNKLDQYVDPGEQNVLRQPTIRGNHSLISQHKQLAQFVIPGEHTSTQDHSRGSPSVSLPRTSTTAGMLGICSEASSAMASSVLDVSMTATTWEPGIDFPDDESPL
jgi:hypothetical protein